MTHEIKKDQIAATHGNHAKGLTYLDDPFLANNESPTALVYFGKVISNGFSEYSICLDIGGAAIVRQRAYFPIDLARAKEMSQFEEWIACSILRSMKEKEISRYTVINGKFVPLVGDTVQSCEPFEEDLLTILEKVLAEKGCLRIA